MSKICNCNPWPKCVILKGKQEHVHFDIVVHSLGKMIILFLVCGDYSQTKLKAFFLPVDL